MGKKNSDFYELCIEYGIMILLVLCSNSMYTVLFKTFSVIHVSFFLSILVFFITVNEARLHLDFNNIRLVFFYVCYYVWMILFFCWTQLYSQNQFITMFILFFPSMVLYLYMRKLNNKLIISIKRLVNTIAVVGIVSIIGWVLFSNFHLLQGVTTYSSWSGQNITSYAWIHFDTQIENFFGMNIIRNTGIYPEAPIFAYVLLCGIFAELFVQDNPRPRIVALLFITLITTLSTTGIIFGVLSITLKVFIFYIKKSRKSTRQKIGVSITIAIFLLPFIGMLLNQKSGSASARVRNDDINAGLTAWKQNLFVGNGFGNMVPIYSSMSYWRKGIGNLSQLGFSSGILSILNDGGLMLLAIYLFPVVGLFLHDKNREKLLALLLMLLVLLVTVVSYIPLTLYILAFMYVYYLV